MGYPAVVYESSYVNGIEILVDGGLAAIYPVKL